MTNTTVDFLSRLNDLAEEFVSSVKQESSVVFKTEKEFNEFTKQHGSFSACLFSVDKKTLITNGYRFLSKLDNVVTQEFSRLIGESNINVRLHRFENLTWLILIKKQNNNGFSLFNAIRDISGRELFVEEEFGVLLTFSAGVVEFEFAKDSNIQLSYETIVSKADSARRIAKEQGGDTIVYYTLEIEQKELRFNNLEQSLRYSLMLKQGFELFYQPKTRVADRVVIGAEALLRWKFDEEYISPLEFIQVAEQSGQMIKLGYLVLEKACRQWKDWEKSISKKGIVFDLPPVAVNVSGEQFKDPDFYTKLLKIIEETQIPLQKLELEITESVAMLSPEKVLPLLKRISDLGICISLDDFGTGYSSLSRICDYSIGTMKIDQSFIKLISTQDTKASKQVKNIISFIISMAKSLNKELVAEGVESQEQLDFINQAGCNTVQGYYYSKPLAAGEYLDYLLQCKN